MPAKTESAAAVAISQYVCHAAYHAVDKRRPVQRLPLLNKFTVYDVCVRLIILKLRMTTSISYQLH